MNLLRAVFIVSVISVFVCIPSYADTLYPNIQWEQKEIENEGWYKQCLSVKDIVPPKSDIPPQGSPYVDCNPIDMYYSAKRIDASSDEDWAKVKTCAFLQNDIEVLMMLYANGFGVAKNVQLATKYACESGGALFEISGRVSHLSAMSDDKEDGIFDVCDDITSGFMMGFCASYAERQNTIVRNERLNSITAQWSSTQKILFENLVRNLNEYALHSGDDETDTSGTARGAFMIEAEAEEKDRFMSDISSFESGSLPSYSSNEFRRIDAELNSIYQEIMRSKPMTEGTRLGFTTITKEGVRRTQKAWLKYRDAWVKFAHTRYPSIAPHSLKAHLTTQRIESLNYLREVSIEGL